MERKQSTTKRVSALDKRIGQNLKLYRKRVGVSQKDLADAVAISFQQIQKYESGTNRLSVSRLIKISSFLKISVEQLIQGTQSTSFPQDQETHELIKVYSRLSTESRQILRHFLGSL